MQSEPRLRRLSNQSGGVKEALEGSPGSQHFFYVDALDRFKRNFIQEEADRRKAERLSNDMKFRIRRQSNQYRERTKEAKEQGVLDKGREKWEENLKLYQAGVRKHANSNGIPVDPVTNDLNPTERAKVMMSQEDRQKLRNLVRANLMESRSSQKYNVINGSTRLEVADLVPASLKGQFEEKRQIVEEYYKLRVPKENYQSSRV